ncbi:MAG: dienelactone hydrolase family protein [Burkholderiales bacterium]|nr:dienelactone hydrolase family protein [Burkholderiales bacterium]
MNGRWIDITSDDGKQFGGYISMPPKSRMEKAPGIVLVQEIWGVNQHIRDVADSYALDGFVVLAPDVFWRQQSRVDLGYNEVDNPKAFALLGALDRPQAARDVASAAATLRAHPACSGRVASVGYCMGGAMSYMNAALGSVDAAVCYYGGGIPDMLDQAAAIKVPVLMHFAEQDHYLPMPQVEKVQQTFAGRADVRIDIYGGVDHGFNCWGRPVYDQKAAALARGRTLSFLSKAIC